LELIYGAQVVIYPEMGVPAPSKTHLALALAIVKQKPPEKNVKGMNMQ
jgi:hypothetical protein